MSAQFFYGECPVCEFSVVTNGVPPKLASNCGMCAADSGRDVWMRFTTRDTPAYVALERARVDRLLFETESV